MASILKLQVITGAYNEGALAYLLQTDDFRFLLDCGWDENFSPEIIEEYKRHIKSIDAVLITYPDIYHLGALPYLVGHCGLKCPVYATIPVYKMGQMFMYDLHQSRSNSEDFTLFTLDHVDAAFDLFVQMKYDQSIQLEGNGQGLTITPLPAGHMIGGAIWKISKEGEEEIVYAVDYNHKKERHLNSSNLTKIIRPTLLITDALNTKYSQGQRKTKDAQLLTTILETMRRDGNVLICVDTAGRVLELALLLEQLWRNEQSGLFAYSLALLNNFSYQVIEFARSQVEWMSEKIVRQFEENRANPFHLRYVKLCHDLSELDKIRAPKVVLASQPDLESGFARDLFIQWVENDKNSIILTTRTCPGTLARELIDKPNLTSIEVEVRRKVPLEGAELEEYMERQRVLNEENAAKAQAEKKKARKLSKRSVDDEIRIEVDVAADDFAEEEDDDDDDDDENQANNKSKSSVADTIIDTGLPDDVKASPLLTPSANRLATLSPFAPKRKGFAMFPYKEEKYACDDYGEIINPNDYMIIETKPSVASDFSPMNFGDSDERHPSSELMDITNSTNLAPDMMAMMIQQASGVLPNNPSQHPLIQQVQHQPSSIPYKTIRDKRELKINAKVIYVDFEARSDRESIEKLLNQIKPKNLIFIHGTQDCIEQLEKYCTVKQIVQGRIFSPRVGEIVDATTERNLYQIKLKDSLLSSITFSKTRDVDVAWVDGVISHGGPPPATPLGTTTFTTVGQANTEWYLNPVSREVKDQMPPHPCVFVNEPKLLNLKMILIQQHGLKAEFVGGVLTCEDTVAIKRNETGKIILEGALSDTYYKVRRILYDQYAIL
ncbi:unnamed protein product [Rotaria socialis]|uniref:Cleavage and polyadenylation specificity factor subunit 2 n=1 Tax=Rotaria socialis TaxID=392032 RepID=A0A820HE98_9BILA|nr:unnamed protein product [Rotaria socialis]CAF3433472.1 unnamed protein product [Rotaria socialis]CAF3441274.1 unnamed protein product [Rotaria socialis]CAF3768878.1 unnamed protein product [Rotaria socialis]CAF3806334.1 unnamed protein product [Rotaria socialis]